jgi:hypothetical protein
VPEIPLRNRSISLLSFSVMVGCLIVGITLVFTGLVPSALTNRAVLSIGGLILIAVSLFMHAAVKLLVLTEANINRVHNNTLDLHDTARRIEPLLKIIADNSQLSDGARSITHRDMELEALRHALREEMYQGNWDAAMYLIEQMQNRFGYAREAEALRKELAQIREMTIEEKIGEAVSHIEKLMEEQHWEKARQESERLMKLFPRHERILGLPAQLNQRREARKQELLQLWNQAVQREEVERGIQILTELDPFLSKEEAQQLQDSARHVFKARLVAMGVSFGLAVSEARWRDALEVGLSIRQEFPNSRMAQEVGEKLDVLRVRAGFVADTEVIQRPAGQSG